MKSKVILAVLTVIGTLVLSGTVAQAGNGGLPSALTSFFACYSINGKDSGQTVDLESAPESPFGTPPRINVRITTGSLACTIVRMLVPPSSATPTEQVNAEPNPTLDVDPDFKAIKCYSVTGPGPGPSGRFSFTDAIWGKLGSLASLADGTPTEDPLAGSLATESGLTISQLKYICGPARVGQ